MIGKRKNGYALFLLIPAAFLLVLIGIKCMSVIKITLIALAACYLLSPFVSYLDKKMPRSLALVIVYASVLLISAIVIMLILLPMLRELASLPEYAGRLESQLNFLKERFSSKFEESSVISGVVSSLPDTIGRSAGKFLSLLIGALSGAAGAFADVLIALALSWFFLLDWEKLSLRMFLSVPSGIRPRVINALKSTRRELGNYFRAQSLLILVMFIITSSVFFLFGVPMPVSLGVMYALLNAVAYIGPLIGTIPPVLCALSVSPVNALYVLSALLIIQQVDNYVLSPRIMGAAAGAGAATTLIAISAGGALYGVTGMFFALPALIAVKSVYRAFTAPKI